MSTSDLRAIPLGERVTVRRRLPDGRATDAVGTLTARDATGVTLRTRRGEVRVPFAAVVAHRLVRPTPWRIGTFLHRAEVAVLGLDCLLRAPVTATVALVDELVEAGIPVFVLSSGTDRVPEELEHLGLGHLVPWLLDAVDHRLATPTPEAYALAHAAIEGRLGRQVGAAAVHFTDDRPADVDAARAFGWQARIFTHPG